MNELQVRLSADIKQLQTALSRAKKTIKDFETETENGSERSNVGFRRKIGLIEQLENKAKKLRVALRQATNEDQVERYNKELNQTVAEMTRLNALGRQVGGSISQTGAAFKKTGGSIVNTNGVALEFNRIIQDSPYVMNNFGSVANNMQQGLGNLTAQFQKGVPASVVWKSLIQSMVSPMNLALLGVSALTAGFTAYQMGAFDFIKTTKDAVDEIKEFREELDKFKESLDAVSRARLDGISSAQKELTIVEALIKQASNTLVDDKNRLSAVKELIKRYPKYLGHLSEEDILLGKTGGALKKLTNDLEQSEIAQSSATAATEKKIEALKVEERLQRNLSELQKNRAREGELVRAGARDIRGLTESESAGVIFTEAEKELLRLRRQQPALLKEIKRDGLELNRITDDQVELQNALNEALEKGGTLTSDFTDKTKIDDLFGSEEEVAKKVKDIEDLYQEMIDNIGKRLESAGLLPGKGGIIDFGVNLGDVPPVEEILPRDEERDLLTKNQLDLLERGGIEIKNQNTLTDQQIESYKKLANELNTIDELSKMIGDNLSSSFEAALFEGESFVESFQKAFTEMLKRLASQLLASAVLKLLGTIIGGSAGGIITTGSGSLFGGARADGGPVSSGKAYLVGERGPEIFQPSTSGRIIPNIPSSPMVSASGASAGVMQKIDVNVYGEIMNDRIVLSEARGKRAIGRFYGING